MKPVFQEIISKGEGDCFSACLASLLEIPLADVPKFNRDNPYPKNMMDAARKWCADNFGLSIITIQMEDEESPYFTGKDIRVMGAVDGTPCIAGGASPNLPDCLHAVVGEIYGHFNFRMTHDPNPSGKGIVGKPKHLYFLIPMNYGKFKEFAK